MTNNNNNASPSDPSNDKPEEHVVTRNQACKLYGDIGHISKDCEKQCHSCGRDHCNGECRLSKVMCLLCEGTDHVLAECHLYATVDEVNQQVKRKLHQSLGKVGAEFEPKGAKHFVTTKRNNPSGRLQETKNNHKKRERFPSIIMEYEKQELEDLLALENPKKKKDISQVECHECKRLGHYSWDCPDKEKRKESEKKGYVINGGQKKDRAQDICFNRRESGHYAINCPEKYSGRDFSLVTCYKCGDKGHYANKCLEKYPERQ
jgi:hypothetical protein